MNILFYTTNEVAPQYGGVERVTANIANALTTFYNVNCYSAYKYNIDKSFIKQQFVNTIKINSYHNLNNLIQFIEQNKIDVIINQGEHKLTKSLRLALNQSQNKKCKLMFALHVSPATEINFITLKETPLVGGNNNCQFLYLLHFTKTAYRSTSCNIHSRLSVHREFLFLQCRLHKVHKFHRHS